MLPQPKPGIMQIAPYVGGKSSTASGKPPIKLSSNENTLGSSPAAMEAYKDAAKYLNRYPDGNATKLREAIAAKWNISPERIVCGAGSDEIIGLLIHAYAGVGDEVLYSRHGFLMYKIYAQGNGATPVEAPEKNYTADVDALLTAVTPKTKILFLANPNNPTGSVLTFSEVKRLRARLPEHIILALDAAYHEYVTHPEYNVGHSLVSESPNTVVMHTFSKVYGLPALRLGWGYMPEHIADVLNRLRGPFNVSSPAIAAGVAAINDTAFLEKSVAHNTQWRAWLSKELTDLGLKVYPSEGNFILVQFKDSAAANAYLLDQNIIVRDVAAYGLPNCLRITIGTTEETQAVAAAMREFLQKFP